MLLSSFASYVVLDYLWFTLVSGEFFFQKMRPVANTNADGEALSIGYLSAAVVYALLALGMVYLVQPEKQENKRESVLKGALYGLVVYGAYDFTNHATLEHWPMDLMAVDVLWGTLSSSMIALFIHRLFNRS